MALTDVTFDAASVFPDPADDTISTMTWTHVVGGGPFNILIVGIAAQSGRDVTTVVWDSGGADTALTELIDDTFSVARVFVWYLIDPAPGSKSIKVTMDGAAPHVAGAASYKHVIQSASAFSDAATFDGVGANHQLVVSNMTSADLAIVFGCQEGTSQESVGASTNERWNDWNTGGGTGTRRWSTGGDEAGTGSVTLGFTIPTGGPDAIARGWRLNQDYPTAKNQAILIG